MSVMKQAVLLLLLLAALCTDAAPTPEECSSLNKRLLTKDLHTVYGDWVLVWAASDDPKELINQTASSHVELRLRSDNKTMEYNERNYFLDKSCITFWFNVSLPADPTDAQHHTLDIEGVLQEKEGVVRRYNETGKIDIYESCPDCLMMVYIEPTYRYLLSYRREGQHGDVEQQKAAHSDHRKRAECLGLPHDDAFAYDGIADFCHRKSAPGAAES